MLRTTIREKDFLDDNATLLPESIKPAHRVKPTKALTEGVCVCVCVCVCGYASVWITCKAKL